MTAHEPLKPTQDAEDVVTRLRAAGNALAEELVATESFDQSLSPGAKQALRNWLRLNDGDDLPGERLPKLRAPEGPKRQVPRPDRLDRRHSDGSSDG